MNILRFIDIELLNKGYDGLAVPGVCGCCLGELSPGSCLSENCEPAYKHTHSQKPTDWIMSTIRTGITDDDIEQCIREC